MAAKKLITNPAKSGFVETILILLTLTLLTATFLIVNLFTWKTQLIFISVLLLLAIILKYFQLMHLLVFCLFWILVPRFFLFSRQWLLLTFLIIAAYLIVVLLIPSLRKSLTWIKFGKFDKRIRCYLPGIIIVSAVALIIWYVLFKPDLSNITTMFPEMPIWLYPLAGLGFATFNALHEEIMFRGIIMQATDSALGAGITSIIVQGIMFGALHFLAGFPRGVSGFALAAIYGIMLGFVRREARGMLAPWLAHVLADLTIFCILASIVI